MTQNVISPGSNDPRCGRDELTMWWQDRRDSDEILLFNIRIAQRVFECGKQVAVNADAPG
jgi:hypothetical protein